MIPQDNLPERLDQPNPLSGDAALFDMYMAVLDTVLAKPEIVIALKEFELSSSRLRIEMMIGAGAVLRSAAPQFAEYEKAFARHLETEGDPRLLTYRSRRDAIRLVRLLAGYACAGSALLLLAGLASVWFWPPAAALIEAGTTLLAVVAVILGFLKILTTEPGRLFLERMARLDDGIELALARNHLMAVSQTELLAKVSENINTARRARFDHKYLVSTSPGLSEVHDSINRVPTKTAQELDDLLARLDGASIGVAGPRGSGKSMLMRQYCDDNDLPGETQFSAERSDGLEWSRDAWGTLRCVVAAPVDYAAKDFVLHLSATFCQAVIRNYERNLSDNNDEAPYLFWLGLAWSVLSAILWRTIFFGGAAVGLVHWQDSIARQLSVPVRWVQYASIAVIFLGALDLARSLAGRRQRWTRRSPQDQLIVTAKKQLAKVRYLQTRTTGLSGGVNFPGGAKGQLTRGISRAEQPLSYPEIVDEFRNFARAVAARANQRGCRVFIGIDELDKIGSAEQAEHFLNEIKGIFGIPYVYFIVSVSSDALTAFERRGLPLRDAFDSSFDEIINVGPLSYAESRRLLYRRIIGLSEPYVALCHCLAGGLARDLIRAARNVVRTASLITQPAAGNAFGESEDPVEYMLASEQPEPHYPTIGIIAEAVIHEELRRKARAISNVANSTGSVEATDFQNLLYDTAGRLSAGEPILHLIDLLAKPCSGESATTAGLRLEFAAYAYYCATLHEVFNGRLDDERIIEASSQPSDPGSFDALAAVRNTFTLNTMLTWRLITEFRSAWSMETREPPSAPFGSDGQMASGLS